MAASYFFSSGWNRRARSRRRPADPAPILDHRHLLRVRVDGLVEFAMVSWLKPSVSHAGECRGSFPVAFLNRDRRFEPKIPGGLIATNVRFPRPPGRPGGNRLPPGCNKLGS